MWKKVYLLLCICLAIFSLTLLVWSFVPSKKQVEVQVVLPARMSVKSKEPEPQAILERRQVELAWSETMRIGGEGVVQLDFQEMDADGASTSQTTDFKDAYGAHNIMVEAMFEVAGLQISPANATRISLLAGQPVSFTWKVNPSRVGLYPGTVWLYLRFLPLDGSAPIQVPVYVKDIHLHATNLMGLSEQSARLLGGVGVLVSLMLLFNTQIRLVVERMKSKKNQAERA